MDYMLPKKGGQTPEERACQLENPLDWMRNSSVNADSPDAIEQFKKQGSVPMSRCTPEQRFNDLKETLNCLCNNGNDNKIMTQLETLVRLLIPYCLRNVVRLLKVMLIQCPVTMLMQIVPMVLSNSRRMELFLCQIAHLSRDPKIWIRWIGCAKILRTMKCCQTPEHCAHQMCSNNVNADSPNTAEQFKKNGSAPMPHFTTKQRSKGL